MYDSQQDHLMDGGTPILVVDSNHNHSATSDWGKNQLQNASPETGNGNGNQDPQQ